MKNRFKTVMLALFVGAALFATPETADGFARKPTKSERISQGVYGTSDALDKGRVDVADIIIKDTKTLVTPPKKPLNIKEIEKTVTDPKTKQKTQTKYVILPAKMDGTVIKKDSEEFKALLEDRELLKKYQEGEKAWVKYSTEVAKTLQQEAKHKEILQEKVVEQQNTIHKQQEKIAGLSQFKKMIYGIVGFFLLLVVLYVLSIFVRLAVGIASVFR